MANYIIQFIEKGNGTGALAVDRIESDIQNIGDEQEVREAIEKSFTLAINALNNRVKRLSFTIENCENEVILCGEGIVLEEKFKIISPKNLIL